MTKLLYNQTIVKACEIDYEDGPIDPKYKLIHTRAWFFENLQKNLKHDAIICMSMGDNGIHENNGTFEIKRWFEKPIFHGKLFSYIKKLYCTHAATQNSIIHGVPCGVMFHEDGTNFAALNSAESLNIPKTKLIYVNFTFTHPLRNIQPKPWYTFENNVPPDIYFRHMKQHKFVLCPPGHGPDSYRPWEALYLSCVPIVLSKNMGGCHHHFNLPILQVDNFNFTEQFLETKWKEFQFKWNTYNWDLLTEEYWINKIKNENI